MELRTVEIPAPIGDVFCHQHRNGTVEHHESEWEGSQAVCRKCGVRAIVSMTPLNLFLRDEILMGQLVQGVEA